MEKLHEKFAKADDNLEILVGIFESLFPRFKEISLEENKDISYTAKERSFFAKLIDFKISRQENNLEVFDKSRGDVGITNKTSNIVDGAQNGQLIARRNAERERLVQHYNVLLSAKNNNHGLCAVTGKSIYYKRMLLVPHTTKSKSAKEKLKKA